MAHSSRWMVLPRKMLLFLLMALPIDGLTNPNWVSKSTAAPAAAVVVTTSPVVIPTLVHEMKVKDHHGTTADAISVMKSPRREFVVASLLATGLLTAALTVEQADALELQPSSTSRQEEQFHHRTTNGRDSKKQNPWTSGEDLLSSSSTISATTVATTTTATTTTAVDWKSIFQKASKKALGGGKAGAYAAVVQVFSLMWLRTSMNYQYRYGGTLQTSLKTLWEEGGIPRFYQGLPFALVQGPMTRFGDTAANVGVLALLETLPETQDLPLPLKTACGSICAGLWRICLMPIDTSKTAMQVNGASAFSKLWGDVLQNGSPGLLYQGSLASAAATAAGHFPWFLTYNFMNEVLPVVAIDDNNLALSLCRSAALGFSASCVSDVCSNSLRVIKTTKQTASLDDNRMKSATNNDVPNKKSSQEGGTGATTTTTRKDISYRDVVTLILEKDGLVGLFGRGLQTRLLVNAVQGSLFSVLWKYFQTVGAQ